MKYFKLKFLTFFLTALLAFGVGWAGEVTDVLDQAFTGVTGSSYISWNNKTGTSGAVYAGNSAASYNSIQLRSTRGSAIVTTKSGGKVKSITVTWNENTPDERTLNIYCNNTAYTSTADFNNNVPDNPYGTIVKGTSTTLSIDNDYSYIAIKSDNGALYLDEIEIVWEVPDAGEPVIRVDPTSLTINEDGGSFNVTGTNLNDDNVGVTAPDGFSRTTNDQDWGFINQGGSVSGTAYVNYTGRDLVASGTVTAANNQTSASVAVTYRPDIYLYGDLSDNNHDDWGDIADGQMERNGDVYSKTITLNEKGFLLFARKTGETYGWDDNRLFFGPAATDNWVYVSDVTNAALDLNPQTQYHPLELPAGIYTITINAVGNTFSISREELPTPIGETCPAVIEFENNYNQDGEPVDGTANFASMENFLKAVGAGSVFIQSANWSYLYPGSTGLKFSSSKNNGSLTINLKPLTSGSWRANKIIINAKSWINSNGATDEGAGFSINGTSFSTTNEFADYELTVDDATALESITIAATKRIYVKSITIMHECGDEPVLEQVAIPTFSPAAGTYTEVQNVEINCATDGATIYYTTDGTEPTTTSSVYSTAITVGETMTIKAMAVKEDMENSAVATAEYIINLPTEVETIAAAQDLDNNTTFNFTGTAVVTFHNGNHLYIRDGSGSGLIYGVDAETKKYNNGDVLTPGWKAKNDVYQVHTPEFTDPSKVGSTVNNGAVEPLPLTTIELGDVNKYAKIDNVTITSNNGQNYYYTVGENQYCLRRAYTDMVGELEVNKTYNVTGVVTIFRSGSKDNYIYTPQLNLISAELIKEDLTLSFDPASVELYVGETFTAPALKGVPEGATIDVTYSSNNTDVAIVTDNVVSLVKGATGTATITATFAGNDEYNEASATYTITVEPKPYVMADPTSLDFEAVIGQDPVTETFTVMAENLKGDITLTLSESDVFTINPPTIAKADMTEEGVEVTVTYTPKAATGEDFDEATVTIKSTDADDVKVNLTGMATLPDPELTVSPETLEMGTDPTGTFTVTGQNLTENVTLTVTVTEGEAKNFEISPATIIPDEEGKVSQEVTVTYKGNSTEDEYATITVKSGIAKKEVIVTARVLPTPEIIAEPENLTMTAVVGQTPATATFTVMASDLRGDITLTMSESDVFKITPASIAKADMTDDGVEVTVTYTPTQAGNDNATITIASEAAESATVTLNGTATVPEVVAMPTFSLVAGSYTGVQQLTISCATEGATISYSTDGGQTWTEGNTVNVDKDMTIMAKASKNGYTISETATAAYIIEIPEELPTITPFKGYYQIKNNGNGMYANIAGRKTLNFTDAPADKAGTVIWLETNDKGQVQSIRSQAADLQGYANRAMRYVSEIVELVADKLNADGEGNLLGHEGLKKIMEKFNESFDHHLYVEQAGEGWRLYGKTPSMQPVVDFYRENTAQVEAKLPMLESFINSALNKLKEKIGGQSVFTDFSLLDIWEKMGGTLTKPVDEASIMAFYREVLNNKNYVWDFAYQTAMIYVNNLTSHDRWSEVEEYLGEYAQYIDKIDQIRPDFKYYVVADGNKPDFISEGNKDIINDAARTIWTLEDRSTFTVNIPANAETTCDKFQKATTLYTDFAYELPEGVTAYKVTDVVEGTAITEALSGVIPAQTPVLLMAAEAGDKVLTLSTEAGTAVTDNLLVGPDYLINTYKLTTPQVEGIFNMIKEKLGEDFYNTYVKEYEHLMYLNSGTVNNKYFWGLKEEDVKKCTYLDEEGVKDYVVRGLEGNAFVNNKQVKTNKAFLVSEDAQIISLNKRGDVNHDGKVNIKDVTDLIDRLLDPENTVACPICSDFNLSGKVDIKDVTDLIDVLLTAPYAEQEQPSTGSQD